MHITNAYIVGSQCVGSVRLLAFPFTRFTLMVNALFITATSNRVSPNRLIGVDLMADLVGLAVDRDRRTQ